MTDFDLEFDHKFAKHYGLGHNSHTLLSILLHARQRASIIVLNGKPFYEISDDYIKSFYNNTNEAMYSLVWLGMKFIINTIYINDCQYIGFSPLIESWKTSAPFKEFTRDDYDKHFNIYARHKPPLQHFVEPPLSIHDNTNIYVVICDITKYYKIGIAKNVKNRMQQIRNANPGARLLFSIPDCSYGIEQSLHMHFKDKNIAREWFDLTESDLQQIPELVKQF